MFHSCFSLRTFSPHPIFILRSSKQNWHQAALTSCVAILLPLYCLLLPFQLKLAANQYICWSENNTPLQLLLKGQEKLVCGISSWKVYLLMRSKRQIQSIYELFFGFTNQEVCCFWTWNVYRILSIYHQSFEVCFGSSEDKLQEYVKHNLGPSRSDLEERRWEKEDMRDKGILNVWLKKKRAYCHRSPKILVALT